MKFFYRSVVSFVFVMFLLSLNVVNASASPVIKNVVINTGDQATNSRNVKVDITYTGTPTYYRVSESSNFSDATWKAFTSRFTYTLSSGHGLKRVYVMLKDKRGVSNSYSRSINYISSTTPWALKLNLNNGNSTTNSRRNKVTWRALGSPTHYQFSESKYFAGVSWKKISSSTPSIKLTPFSGDKTVYLRLKNKTGISPIIKTTIRLEEPANLLVSTTVNPSKKSQNIKISENASLTIPGGLLTKPKLLRVKSNPTPADYLVTGLHALETYDIALGDMHDFRNKPLKLTYKYDPALVLPSSAPEHQFYTSYWDNDAKIWVFDPVLVYRNENKIVVSIKHLSTRTVSQQREPRVKYEAHNFSRTLYDTRLNGVDKTGIEGFQKRVSNHVEEALKAYRDTGFKIPSSQLLVAIFAFDADKVAEYGSGMISLAPTYADDDELKFAIYHEAFHAVQNEYFSKLGMYINRWFIEATADYAAGAFSGLYNRMGEGLTHRFLEKSITYDPDINDQHKYQVAHFIKYAFSGSFSEMFKYIAQDSWYESCISAWDNYIKSKGLGSLAGTYQQFARNYVFDSSSPAPAIEDTLRTSVAVDPKTLRYGEDEVEGALDLEASYSAKVWGVWVDGDDDGYRYLKASVGGAIPDRMEIDVFQVADDSVRSGGRVGTLTKMSPQLQFRLSPGYSVYMLAVNANSESGRLQLNLSDLSPKIESILPEEAAWGEEVVIKGKRFGATRGSSLISGLNEYNAINITSWADTQIKFNLPVTMPNTYDLYVQRDGGDLGQYVAGDFAQFAVNISPNIKAKNIYSSSFVGIHSYTGNCPDSYMCPSGSSSIDGSYGINHTAAPVAPLVWNDNSFSAQVSTTTSTGFVYSFSISGEIDETGKLLKTLTFNQTWIKNSKAGYKTYLHTGDVHWVASNIPIYLHPGIDESIIIFSAFPSNGSLSPFISQVRDNVVEREEICDNPPTNTINCRWGRNFAKNYSSTNSSSSWQVSISLQ